MGLEVFNEPARNREGTGRAARSRLRASKDAASCWRKRSGEERNGNLSRYRWFMWCLFPLLPQLNKAWTRPPVSGGLCFCTGKCRTCSHRVLLTPQSGQGLVLSRPYDGILAVITPPASCLTRSPANVRLIFERSGIAGLTGNPDKDVTTGGVRVKFWWPSGGAGRFSRRIYGPGHPVTGSWHFINPL